MPAGQVERYTVGRREILDRFRDDLDVLAKGANRSERSDVPGMRVLIGDYGTGKSHLLEWLREEGMARKFLVAQTALDDREITPAHPKRVYRELLASLAYPDRPATDRGLLPLLERALESDRFPRGRDCPRYHRYLDPAMLGVARARTADDPALLTQVLEWIEGQPFTDSSSFNRLVRKLKGPRFLALPDFRTFSHVYAYVLGGIASLARDVGYGGLIVLMDEAEFYQTLSAVNRSHARHLLACLALAALGPSGVCFDPVQLFKGGMSVHRRIPFVYEDDQPLYVVVSLTPVRDIIGTLATLVPIERIALELAPLTPDDYRCLFRKVVSLYPVPGPQRSLLSRLADPMGRALFAGVETGALATPRAVLKLVVEFLDILKHRPSRCARFTQELITRLFQGTPP